MMAIGSHLIAVIRRDSNNQILPIAIALIESKCKDSRSWFLDTSTNAIGTPFEKGWIFLLDRQKVSITLTYFLHFLFIY